MSRMGSQIARLRRAVRSQTGIDFNLERYEILNIQKYQFILYMI